MRLSHGSLAAGVQPGGCGLRIHSKKNPYMKKSNMKVTLTPSIFWVGVTQSGYVSALCFYRFDTLWGQSHPAKTVPALLNCCISPYLININNFPTMIMLDTSAMYDSLTRVAEAISVPYWVCCWPGC